MTVVKIIVCIVLCLLHFFALVDHTSLRELKKQATEGEKKALERIENVAIFLPLIIMFFIIIQ